LTLREYFRQTDKYSLRLSVCERFYTFENSIGRISRMDAINNKSVADAAMRNKKAKLTKLRVAVVKVDEEGFGSCIMCDHPIQAMRLMFMPESTKCVRCASR